jgi:hypothetical protein
MLSGTPSGVSPEVITMTSHSPAKVFFDWAVFVVL